MGEEAAALLRRAREGVTMVMMSMVVSTSIRDFAPVYGHGWYDIRFSGCPVCRAPNSAFETTLEAPSTGVPVQDGESGLKNGSAERGVDHACLVCSPSHRGSLRPLRGVAARAHPR